MRHTERALLGCFLLAIATVSKAGLIADSLSEFSSTQGQDSWRYGFFNAGAAPGAAYTSGDFVAFDTFDVAATRWAASAAQVGSQNNIFLSLDSAGGHPNGIGPDAQDSIIWAVRRYTSEVAGVIDLNYHLRKRNISNPNGGGITGHIFVDGVELLDQFIANLDGIGTQGVLSVAVNVGTLIDFAIDPTGTTSARDPSIHNARADGTDFTARILTHEISEPDTGWLVLASCLGIGCLRRYFVDRTVVEQ